jgi:hypothetical protein
VSTHDATSTVPIGHCCYCGIQHGGGKCPLVSAIEYADNGTVRRVEFFREEAPPPGPIAPESDNDYLHRILARIGPNTVNSKRLLTAGTFELDEIGGYYNITRRA